MHKMLYLSAIAFSVIVSQAREIATNLLAVFWYIYIYIHSFIH